jgi:hypothetical protein
MMMGKYEYCLDTCLLYASVDTYKRKQNLMDGDGYCGKDTQPPTIELGTRVLEQES